MNQDVQNEKYKNLAFMKLIINENVLSFNTKKRKMRISMFF